jgi:hypothetical protein
MLTLKSDNRVLTANEKFAFLLQNNQKNVSSVDLSNIEPFAVGDPILFGDFGQTDAEILKIYSITDDTIALGTKDNVPTTTNYSHPESTKIVKLQFDQIRFFWTPALGTIADEDPVFDYLTPLTDWVSIDPTSFFTSFTDVNHSTGFGWFVYRNALTHETSRESNAIPYIGFKANTVQQVFNDFESLLNTNELKLVSIYDKYSWINEALAILKVKLNLTNAEYTVSEPQVITTLSGVDEYLLPDDFSDLTEIKGQDGFNLEFLPISQKMQYNSTMPSTIKYYLRGRYIGFTPTPLTGSVFTYTYHKKSETVANGSTYLDLPDNAFYSLKDFMMYRACLKFNNPLSTVYYQAFKNSMDLYIQSAIKRSADLDSWEIDISNNT